MHGAFADDEVIHRWSEARLILYNVRCKVRLFFAREVHKVYFDVPLEVPHNCRVALLITGKLLEAPFFIKKEVTTQPGVKQDSNCLILDNQPLAVVFFMLFSANSTKVS
jgi:hypothetical protein